MQISVRRKREKEAARKSVRRESRLFGSKMMLCVMLAAAGLLDVCRLGREISFLDSRCYVAQHAGLVGDFLLDC